MAVENHREAVPDGGAGGFATCDGGEGADVVGIGHHAYRQVGAIIRVVLRSAHLEGYLQVVDTVVEQGHHSPALVVAAIVAVEIERTGARVGDGLGVGVLRGGVQHAFLPAGVDGCRRAGAGTLETIEVGQRVDGGAGGSHRNGAGPAVVVVGALGIDIDVVERAGQQVGQRVGMRSGILRHCRVGLEALSGGYVGHLPGSGCAVGVLPVDGDILVVDSSD